MREQKGQAIVEWCIFGTMSLFLCLAILRAALIAQSKVMGQAGSVFAARQALSKSETPTILGVSIQKITIKNSSIGIANVKVPETPTYKASKKITLPR